MRNVIVMEICAESVIYPDVNTIIIRVIIKNTSNLFSKKGLSIRTNPNGFIKKKDFEQRLNYITESFKYCDIPVNKVESHMSESFDLKRREEKTDNIILETNSLSFVDLRNIGLEVVNKKGRIIGQMNVDINKLNKKNYSITC